VELVELLAGVQVVIPEPVWKRVKLLSPMPGLDASSKAGKKGATVPQPKMIEWDDKGTACSQQDEFVESISVEEMKWEGTIAPKSLLLEVNKSKLLITLNQATLALAELSKDMVSISRSSRGEVEVKAMVDVKVGGLAFAPGVAGLASITVVKQGVSISPLCVQIDGLVVAPSTRLPPRGIKLADWDKDAFLNPFWIMERSPIVERSNFMLVSVAAAALRSLSLETDSLHLAVSTVTAADSHQVPVIVNHKPLKKGDIMVVETTDPGRKQAKVPKTVRWDTVKR